MRRSLKSGSTNSIERVLQPLAANGRGLTLRDSAAALIGRETLKLPKTTRGFETREYIQERRYYTGYSVVKFYPRLRNAGHHAGSARKGC